MLLRNGIIVVILASQAALQCVIPLVMMLLVSAVLWRRVPGAAKEGETPPVLNLESPFKLLVALKFGAVFLVLNVAGALAQRYFGSASFYFVSMAGGLLSSASSIAAAATLMARHEITISTGVNGIILSSLTSVLANIPLIRSLIQEPALKRRTCFALVGVAAVGLVGGIVNDFVFHLVPQITH